MEFSSVIHQLGQTDTQYINYRNSKLTKLMENVLRDESAITLIACISPANTNFSESFHTLQFASRAKKIKSKLTIKKIERKKKSGTPQRGISSQENKWQSPLDLEFDEDLEEFDSQSQV